MRTRITQKLTALSLLVIGVFIYTSTNAQSCAANKVRVYRCCGHISSRCIKPEQTSYFLSTGWQLEPCAYPCWIRTSETMSNNPEWLNMYPIPVSNTTTISFFLDQSQNVSIRVFDAYGKLVSTIADKYYEAGIKELLWNAENLVSGIYFLQLQSDEYQERIRFVVTK